MNIVLRDDSKIKHYLKWFNGYPVECKWYKELDYTIVDYNDYAKSMGYNSYNEYLLNDINELNSFLDAVLDGDVDFEENSRRGTIYSIKNKKRGIR